MSGSVKVQAAIGILLGVLVVGFVLFKVSQVSSDEPIPRSDNIVEEETAE
jgi:hypothetical protein